MRPYCLGLHNDWETNGRVSVMYWGCILYYGVGTLVPVEGNMNTEQYISTLDDNLWPIIVRHFSNNGWIFQEDIAPFQASAI